MTITLPDQIRENLEAQARAGGFESIEHYLESLVEGDAAFEWTESDRKRLIALAEEGFLTPPIKQPEGFLNELVRRTKAGEPIGDLE